MKLIDDFFYILETSIGELGFSTTIKLNPDHMVYAGHFPGHPVTPGVIQLQIVHELIENHFDKNVRLNTIPDCKFLNIVNPNETAQLFVHIEFNRTGDELTIKARGENGGTTFFKLKATYQFI